MKKINKNIFLIILGFLACLNILAWIAVYDLNQPRFLEVNFFDVGQGDAIFIETPKGQQILIDGGPGSTILEKLGENLPFWDRSIDLIILTHPEYDHMAGLLEVLKRYKVENILWTGVARETFEYKEWIRAIQNENAKIKIATAGQKILYGPGPGNFLEVLYPFENLEGQEIKNSNDTSIIGRLIFGQDSFLFTGDVGESVEKKLIESGVNLNSDILKVAHHGSKTSSAEEFLKVISPEIAILQVGENRYGHPHQVVLERLKEQNIKILRNDEAGDIKIISDGNKYKIKK